MRKLFTVLAVLLFTAPLHAQTITPNLKLKLPAAQAGTWGEDYNNNFTILDSAGVGHTIEDEGKPLPARAGLNFMGDGVICSDNAAANQTDCIVTGAAGSTGTFFDSLFTLQDNGDATKQARFELSGFPTATLYTFSLPPANTSILGGSLFAGTHTGDMRRTGTGTYAVCRDNDAGTAPPGSSDDTFNNYCIGSRWTQTNVTPRLMWQATNVTTSNAVWLPLGTTTEADTQQTVFDRGKVISTTSANSYINAFRPAGFALYNDATLGPIFTCVGLAGAENACDWIRTIAATYKYQLKDSAGAIMQNFDTNQSTPNARMGSIAAAWQPVKIIAIPAGAFSIGGACTRTSDEVILASANPVDTLTCTDIDTDFITATFPMPKAWNKGTITVSVFAHSITNQTTLVLGTDWAGQCIKNGDQEVVYSATGAQTVNLTFGAQTSDNRSATSAAITLNGTCTGAAGSGHVDVRLRGRIRATATTATMANVRILKAIVSYSSDSLSD